MDPLSQPVSGYIEVKPERSEVPADHPNVHYNLSPLENCNIKDEQDTKFGYNLDDYKGVVEKMNEANAYPRTLVLNVNNTEEAYAQHHGDWKNRHRCVTMDATYTDVALIKTEVDNNDVLRMLTADE